MVGAGRWPALLHRFSSIDEFDLGGPGYITVDAGVGFVGQEGLQGGHHVRRQLGVLEPGRDGPVVVGGQGEGGRAGQEGAGADQVGLVDALPDGLVLGFAGFRE